MTFSASITITCVDGIRKCWNGFGLWLWLGLGILPTTNYRSVLRSLLSAIALAKVDGEGGSPITVYRRPHQSSLYDPPHLFRKFISVVIRE